MELRSLLLLHLRQLLYDNNRLWSIRHKKINEKEVRKMRRSLIGILLALVLVLMPISGVGAATTQDVSVNATPAYVTISNTPDNYGFGTVAVSTNTSTAQGYFNITNSSTVNIDIAISCNATWAGGNTWTHSDTGTPGSTTAALYCSQDDSGFDIIVKNGTPNDLISNTALDNIEWELRLCSPTVYDDGVLKTNTVTLTATAT